MVRCGLTGARGVAVPAAAASGGNSSSSVRGRLGASAPVPTDAPATGTRGTGRVAGAKGIHADTVHTPSRTPAEKRPPESVARSRIPARPCPTGCADVAGAGGSTGRAMIPVVVRAGRTGSGSVRLRTDTDTPSGSQASSTSTGCATSPCRSTLVSASWTIRYTASCCPVPNSPGWPVSANWIVRPVERICSMRSLSSFSSGWGVSSSLCRSCARRIRTSPSAWRAVDEMVRSAWSAASGSTSRA
ncbi:hypothetical protein BFL37_09370 [Clavibacter michiganensis]|uniref:Uncharacterized protein n=1 Tax=Clavibacter michiganensis TaxID=28447 RepID=A0A251YLU4_9MICO|nr:hypothetical protein BFL37_09370 [Clavibacter michiganensis]